MKDLTTIADGDVVLWERQRLGTSAGRRDAVGIVADDDMAKKRARYERCIPVAHDILEEARAALAVRFRFLDRALWRMPLEPSFDVYGIASDGVRLYYDPEYVVARFGVSLNEVIRDVAHCLFHCIFRHPFMLYSVLRAPWDVACDIAIESLLLDLLGEAFPGNMDRRARDALKVIGAHLGGVVTAERLYHFFCGTGNHVDLRSLAPMFYHDAHGLWYGADDASGVARGSHLSVARQEVRDGEGAALPTTVGSASLNDVRSVALPPSVGSALDAGEGQEARDDTGGAVEEGGAGGGDVGGAGGAGDGPEPERASEHARDDSALADLWQDIGQQMQVELETQMARRGEGAGNLVAALKAVNRERYDYADFLRRFATLHERMRMNPDEFDYVYYTYGMDRYGNMPLVEPLEYREDHVVREFVIAIDTSESVSGDLVQAFVRKTYNMLRQTESFHDHVNIHVIQCDARVQDDTKICSLEQLDLYLASMELVGFGGTDFRPVFEYVDLLVAKGEFTNLRGLVYFTDGQGVFPRRRPAYDAAFVFLDDGYSNPEIPPWALKVILDKRELQGNETSIRSER